MIVVKLMRCLKKLNALHKFRLNNMLLKIIRRIRIKEILMNQLLENLNLDV